LDIPPEDPNSVEESYKIITQRESEGLEMYKKTTGMGGNLAKWEVNIDWEGCINLTHSFSSSQY